MNNFDKIIEKYRKSLNFEIGTHGHIMLKDLASDIRLEQIKKDRFRFKIKNN
jgi:hypothetical protein